MILGMSIHTFTIVHVIISLVGIVAGVIVAVTMARGQYLSSLTGLTLLALVLTSVSGFFFPDPTFTPAQGVGIVSLVVLAIAVVALYLLHLKGMWRWIYVATAMIAIYLNCFVGVIQAFQKIDVLHALAPTQSTEPAFVVAQLILIAFFVVLGYGALKKFHPHAA